MKYIHKWDDRSKKIENIYEDRCVYPYLSAVKINGKIYYEVGRDPSTFESVYISKFHYDLMRIFFPFYCIMKAIDVFLFYRWGQTNNDGYESSQIHTWNLKTFAYSWHWIKRAFLTPDPSRDIVNLAGKVWKKSWGVYNSFWA